MPGPFPGMDPYLEHPDLWPGVHHLLISASVEQLQPQLLPRGYVAAVESRVWLEEPERPVIPDLAIRKPRPEPTAAQPGGILLVDEPIRIPSQVDEAHEDYIQIYEVGSNRLVTGIEFVSPTNKRDHRARDLYIQKRRELASTGVNVVEIDLLLGGTPLVRLPRSLIETIPTDRYLINILRAGGADHEFDPVPLAERLPRIRVPLKPVEDDVALDLQAAIGRAYDLGAYDLRIDYRADPPFPLAAEALTWLGELLMARGLRPAAS